MFDELPWQASTLQINDQKHLVYISVEEDKFSFGFENLRDRETQLTTAPLSSFIHNALAWIIYFLYSLSAGFHKFKRDRQHVCVLLLLQYDDHQVIRNSLWVGVVGGKSLRFVVKFIFNS